MGGKGFKKGCNSSGKGYNGKNSKNIDDGKNNNWAGKGNDWNTWQGDASWSSDGGWSQKGKASDAGTDWTGPTEKQYGRRILSKDLLSKRVLKVVHDETGSAIVGGTESLALNSFRSVIGPDASELDARAPYGFSMLLSAIKGLSNHIQSLPSQANQPIRSFFQSERGQRLLELCQILQFDRIKSTPERHIRQFKEVIQILQQNKDLMSQLPGSIAESAGTYLGLVWLYDGLIHCNGLRMWSERTPDVEYLQSAIDSWKASAPSADTTAQFLAQSYGARRVYEQSWAIKKNSFGSGGNTDWKEDGPDVEEAEEEPENAWENLASKGRKEKSRDDKKDKKKKKKASSSSDKSGSSESTKNKKKKKKQKKSSKKERQASEVSAASAKKRKKNKEDKEENHSLGSRTPEVQDKSDEKTIEESLPIAEDDPEKPMS